MRQLTTLMAIAMLCFVALPAQAAFDLQVTEIWPGNNPGSDDVTEDWFEVTNIGDTAWTAATDGDLYYDDDGAEVAKADLMSGVASIAPGESVVFVDGDMLGAGIWSDVWSAVVTLPQVGYYEGSGLGGGGDAVTLFLDDVAAGINLTQIDYEAYPYADDNGGQSYDVVLGAFSVVGNPAGAVATIVQNDILQPAIGSPGTVGVPEPCSLTLVGLGLVGLLVRRNRK